MSFFKLKLLVSRKAWQADGCSLKCASSRGEPWKHEDDLGDGQMLGKDVSNSNHIEGE